MSVDNSSLRNPLLVIASTLSVSLLNIRNINKVMADTKHIPEYEAMDIILKYLIDNKSQQALHSNNIWAAVFPDQPPEVFNMLLKKISSAVDPVVTYMPRHEELYRYEAFFKATALTELFLNNGGFTKQYQDEEIARQEQLRIDGLNKVKLE